MAFPHECLSEFPHIRYSSNMLNKIKGGVTKIRIFVQFDNQSCYIRCFIFTIFYYFCQGYNVCLKYVLWKKMASGPWNKRAGITSFLRKISSVHIIFTYGIFSSKIVYYEIKDCLYLLSGTKQYLTYSKNAIMLLRIMV